MAGVGNFLGGFAQAFGQAQQQKQNMQLQKELKDLQVKQFKNQLELQEKQNLARQQLFDMTSVPVDGEGPSRGVLDVLSDPRGQMLALQSGLIGAGQLFKENRLRDQNAMMEQFLSGGEDIGGGSPFTPASLQKYALTRDPRQLRESDLDKPLSPNELVKFPGVKPGATLRDVQDIEPQPESEIKIEQKLRPAKQIVADLETVVNKVFPEGDFLERVGKGFEFTQQAATREDPDIVFLLDFQSKLAPLVKSLGESGALATEDVQRAEKFIPRLFPVPDSKEVALSKVKELKKIINSTQTKSSGSTLDDERRKRLEELRKKQAQ